MSSNISLVSIHFATRAGAALALSLSVAACTKSVDFPSPASIPALRPLPPSLHLASTKMADQSTTSLLEPSKTTTTDSPTTDSSQQPLPTQQPLPQLPIEKSNLLPSGLYNPMPGGVMAGYRGDTGLDIAGNRQPVYAIASGTLDYSEAGHTLWTGPSDTPYCIRIQLDAPIPWKEKKITHVYYAHLSQLEFQQAEGAEERIRVEGGQRLGVSGVARGSPHLHIGFLLDNQVEQTWGTYLLEDDIRQILGGYRKGARLDRINP